MWQQEGPGISAGHCESLGGNSKQLSWGKVVLGHMRTLAQAQHSGERHWTGVQGTIILLGLLKRGKWVPFKGEREEGWEMWQFGLVATSELSDDSISAGCTSHLAAPLSYHLHLWFVLISTNWPSELIRFYQSCKYCVIHLLYCLQSCEDAGGEEKGVFLGNKEPLLCSAIPAQCLYCNYELCKAWLPLHFSSQHFICSCIWLCLCCWVFFWFLCRNICNCWLLLEYVSSKLQLIKSH